MTYSLKNIVSWGRTFNEYQTMFGLTSDDLSKTILGCADGPASFNAEMTEKNGRYQTASLPHLSFEDNHFDLALCSHFLFLYSEQLTEYFHYQSIKELKRVA